MTLVVEDGTGKTDAESYISVADATTLIGKRSWPATWTAAWTAADTSSKEALLREATNYIGRKFAKSWRGLRKTQDQALAWPRSRAYDDDGYSVGSDSIPAYLEEATVVVALKIATGDATVERQSTGFLEGLKVDVVNLQFTVPVSSLPMEEELLQPIIRYARTIAGGIVLLSARREGAW